MGIILNLTGKMATGLSKADHDELCCSYAALLLHDEGLEITAEKLDAVIKATGNTVDSHWTGLFAKALSEANIGDMLESCSKAGPAVGPAAGGGAAAVEEKPKEEEKKEEVEAVDMGGLFGDDDDY